MKLFVATTAVLGATLLAPVASADNLTGTLKKIKETGVITLGHRDSSIPFSYLDDNQKPIGYSIDLCMKIVDAVKAAVGAPKLEVKLLPVTSSSRIPLIANGTVDLECGGTTNNLERQQQVAFTLTEFITSNRFVSKKAAGIKSLTDLRGKMVASTGGSYNLKEIIVLNQEKNLGMTIYPSKDHADGFLAVETDRAAAFVMDDVLLYGFVANAKAPADYVVSKDSLSVAPTAIMLPKGDPAFKKVVDDAMLKVYRSGEIKKLYAKWFESPIPPKNINLRLPMSDALKRVIANPTDSGDPAVYQ